MTTPVKPLQADVIRLLLVVNFIAFGFLTIGDFDSPLNKLTIPIIDFFSSVGDGSIDKESLSFSVLNFITHLAIMQCVATVLLLSHRRAVFGSFKAARAARKAENAKLKSANNRVDLGKVQSVSVEQGGVLGNTMSTIETEKGIYRVFGDVGSVEKGELVSRRAHTLYLGLSKGTGYTMKQ
ncbi:hypothetical protein [Vibrio fluvialis]|uniref:hypothetical protein n=1 Tax=Vibrio fluvialis TaxID=676 RepID=UPI0023A972EF|nr:hypothetical protein [Vibrio fluvialis]MDE5179101.1 hypothetical protein [Vibrio fluvialis]